MCVRVAALWKDADLAAPQPAARERRGQVEMLWGRGPAR
jgi:hypothetical protein